MVYKLDREIQLTRLPVTKASLLAMPEAERTLFLMLGHACNEINILNRLLFWSANHRHTDKVHLGAQNSQTLLLDRLLAGKLKEAWVLLGKLFFGARLSRELEPELSEAGQTALANLKSYFGKANLIDRVRSDFAFHHTPSLIAGHLDGIPETEPWEILVGQATGNCLYAVADVAANYALLREINPSSIEGAMQTLLDEILTVAHWFGDFIPDCLSTILRRNIYTDAAIVDDASTQVRMRDIPSFFDVILPALADTTTRSTKK